MNRKTSELVYDKNFGDVLNKPILIKNNKIMLMRIQITPKLIKKCKEKQILALDHL
jgi:hypothetical protein